MKSNAPIYAIGDIHGSKRLLCDLLAQMMRTVSLIPSDTGQPGGREVGQKMSHYIEAGGAFATACADLMSHGFDALYVELWNEGEAATRKKKAASKTRYTCEECGLNAWAKPGADLRRV